MPNHIVKDNQVHFRQGYPRNVLSKLFTIIINELGLTIGDTGNKVYPHSLEISESEFLYVIELSGE